MSQEKFREEFLEKAKKRNSRLILALDGKDWKKIKKVIEKTAKHLAAVKIHPEHPKIWGFEHEEAIAEIKKIEDLPIILDAKLADIDKSNETKTEFFLEKGYDAIICHGFPGESSVKAIVKKADELGKGVFLLTAMTSPGHLFSIDKVKALARMAKHLDVAGVIAPGNQYELTALIRNRIGKKQLILSPGVGAQGGETEKALRAGTDLPIIGRAIINAENPEEKAKQLKKESAGIGKKAISIEQELVRTLIEKEALRFGDFTLKSGRKSTYFFNTGNLDNGKALDEIGEAYADKIAEIMRTKKITGLYGPAYKGIPLATAASIALYTKHGINLPVIYDRKEQKEHGDLKDKWLVGNPKQGDRLVLIDDVITTGDTKLEAIEKISALGKDIQVTNAIVLLDRQEKTPAGKNPVKEMEKKGLEVTCILKARDVFECLKEKIGKETYKRFKEQQEEYGI